MSRGRTLQHEGIVMPIRAPRICGCGHHVPSGTQCECQRRREAERKARHDRNRPSARERGYDTKWQKVRSVFLKANPRCGRCGAPSTVVDHIMPHRGNMRLFWSRANWQALCGTCHSGWKQSAEHRQAVCDD